MVWLRIAVLGFLVLLVAPPAPGEGVRSGAPPADVRAPTRNYYAYVCAESQDEVALVRFGPRGLEVVKTIEVGSFPAETEGPHGIGLSPDGRYWYVSLAHGFPYGSIHKYETGTDEWIGDVTVGMFPATLTVSPTTGLLYVVNFDLYGEPKPSSISIVETSTMTEVGRVETGIMPHGSRLNMAGDRHYSVNMMQDELVEMDALRFEITRRLPLSSLAANRSQARVSGHEAHSMRDLVQPTWVTKPTADGRLYVTGQSRNLIFEVNLSNWGVTRTFKSSGARGQGPYNLALTPDGKTLVVTYKKGSAVGFWDLASGEEAARVRTSRRVPHGVAVSDDGRYAFVTVEGVGGEPGTVEVYSLASHRRLATVDVGKQAGGIALWQGQP